MFSKRSLSTQPRADTLDTAFPTLAHSSKLGSTTWKILFAMFLLFNFLLFNSALYIALIYVSEVWLHKFKPRGVGGMQGWGKRRALHKSLRGFCLLVFGWSLDQWHLCKLWKSQGVQKGIFHLKVLKLEGGHRSLPLFPPTLFCKMPLTTWKGNNY